MVNSRAPQVGAVLAASLLSFALAGCTSGADPGEAPVTPGTSAQEPPAGQGEAASSAAAAPVVDGGECESGDLRLSFDGGDAAAGTSYRSLVFTNVSGQACVLQGFPGVSYVAGDDGHQVGAPAVRDGGAGEPITLGKGKAASATVGFVNVRNYDAVDCRPRAVRGVRVYPPGEKLAKFVELHGTGCANDRLQQLTVKSLRAGSGR